MHKMFFVASLVLLLIIKLRFPEGKSIHHVHFIINMIVFNEIKII